MFKSATIRLTIWYLAILMAISLTFSAIIYQITSNEVQRRLERFQTSLQSQEKQFDSEPNVDGEEAPIIPVKMTSTLRNDEQKKAQDSILLQLIYINSWVFIIGGFSSYFLARRHLRPIEKAHAAQSRFTSDASHELRTPLAAMKTEIEVALKDKNSTNSDLRNVLSSNLEEVNKLTKLSSMLLNLSRLDNNNLPFEKIDLNKMIAALADDFRLSTNRLEVTDITKHNCIYGNETAIFDLIKIILDNAIKYSKPNSKIQLKLSRKENQACIEVINIGTGISQKDITHIFERFFKADASRTNKNSDDKKSYGLGLALAKKIVDLHHGKIIVESIPDKTTTFTILLPVNRKTKAKTKN